MFLITLEIATWSVLGFSSVWRMLVVMPAVWLQQCSVLNVKITPTFWAASANCRFPLRALQVNDLNVCGSWAFAFFAHCLTNILGVQSTRKSAMFNLESLPEFSGKEAALYHTIRYAYLNMCELHATTGLFTSMCVHIVLEHCTSLQHFVTSIAEIEVWL